MRCRLRQRSRAYPRHFAAEKLITGSTATTSNFHIKLERATVQRAYRCLRDVRFPP